MHNKINPLKIKVMTTEKSKLILSLCEDLTDYLINDTEKKKHLIKKLHLQKRF